MNDKVYLDKYGAHKEINRMGFNFSERQVFMMFVARELPVFKERGRLWIDRDLLHKHFEDKQAKAVVSTKRK